MFQMTWEQVFTCGGRDPPEGRDAMIWCLRKLSPKGLATGVDEVGRNQTLTLLKHLPHNSEYLIKCLSQWGFKAKKKIIQIIVNGPVGI